MEEFIWTVNLRSHVESACLDINSIWVVKICKSQGVLLIYVEKLIKKQQHKKQTDCECKTFFTSKIPPGPAG